MVQGSVKVCRLVQIMSYPGVSLLDLAGALEVFLAANHYADPKMHPYQVSILALQGDVEILGGLSLRVEVLDSETPPPDTFIVPGGPGIDRFCEDSNFGIFANHVEKVRRLVSVCTGIYALAQTGQLDGRKVTTHWSALDDLEKKYPKMIVERGPIFVRDGEIWTSAGVTAGIDLSLSLVEVDLGHAAALVVARHLVVFLKRSGGQSQFSPSLMLQSDSSRFSELHAWVTANVSKDLAVPYLAEFMNMSERTFVRKYKAETGRTPKKMVEAIRLDAVRQLLAASKLPLREIVKQTGLGSEQTLIRLFIKSTGVTPYEYRLSFATVN